MITFRTLVADATANLLNEIAGLDIAPSGMKKRGTVSLAVKIDATVADAANIVTELTERYPHDSGVVEYCDIVKCRIREAAYD